MPVNKARHVPLARQSSSWVGQTDESFDFGAGAVAHVFHRQVGDGMLRAIVGHEPIGPNDELRWHVSISFVDRRGQPTRYPTWDEQVHCLREIGERGITWAMFLPPDGDGYVNLHPTTMHWHEADEDPR